MGAQSQSPFLLTVWKPECLQDSINIACCVDWSIVNYCCWTMAPMCLYLLYIYLKLLKTCTACDYPRPSSSIFAYWYQSNIGGGNEAKLCIHVWTMHKSICMYIPSPLTCIYWILLCLFDSTWYAVFSNHVPTSLFLVSVESQLYHIMFKTRDLISHRFYILWKKWRLINSRIATKLPLALSQVIFQLLRHATLLLYLI